MRPRPVRTYVYLDQYHPDLIYPTGMLSFAIYYLLKNPEAMRKLREEVDTMIGQRAVTVNDVHKLPYLIGGYNFVH